MTAAPHLARIDAILADTGHHRTSTASTAYARHHGSRPTPYMPTKAQQAEAKAKREHPAAGSDDDATYRAVYGTTDEPTKPSPADTKAYDKVFGTDDGPDKGTATEQATYRSLFGN